MERRPIHLTVYVWNVPRKLKINPFNKLVNFQLWFHSGMLFAFLFCRGHMNERHSLPQKEKANFSTWYILARKVWNFRKFVIDSCRWWIVYFYWFQWFRFVHSLFDRIEGSNRQVLLSISTNLFYRRINSSLTVDSQFRSKDIQVWEIERVNSICQGLPSIFLSNSCQMQGRIENQGIN